MNNLEYIIADFTFNVFELFRTWIAPNIDTTIVCTYTTKVASTVNNIIYINMEDIMNRHIDILYKSKERYILETKRFILEVIVHELYHVEQDVINFRYNSDSDYKMEIEYQVIHMTSVFLLKNAYYIKQVFGITLNEESLYRKMNYTNSKLSSFYDRYINNSSSYYLNMISGIIKKGSDLNVKDTVFKVIDSKNIIVILNGVEHIIKKDYVYNNNYNELNILNKYINGTSLIGELETKVSFKNDLCVIQIKDNTLKALFSTVRKEN